MASRRSAAAPPSLDNDVSDDGSGEAEGNGEQDDEGLQVAAKESRHDGYPVLMGMVRNGEVIPRSADLELFAILEPFLHERKVCSYRSRAGLLQLPRYG